MKKTLKFGLGRRPSNISIFQYFCWLGENQVACQNSASWVPWKWSKKLWESSVWVGNIPTTFIPQPSFDGLSLGAEFYQLKNFIQKNLHPDHKSNKQGYRMFQQTLLKHLPSQSDGCWQSSYWTCLQPLTWSITRSSSRSAPQPGLEVTTLTEAKVSTQMAIFLLHIQLRLVFLIDQYLDLYLLITNVLLEQFITILKKMSLKQFKTFN